MDKDNLSSMRKRVLGNRYIQVGEASRNYKTFCLYRMCNSGKYKMTEFFMPMIPPTTTAQQHKISNGQFYDPPKVKAAKAKLLDNLALHVPAIMYTGSVRLTVKWLFPITARHKNGEYKYTRPDTDNLQKLLKDCMTKCGFWKDDALVASEIIEKFWADHPGIYIKIEELI